MKRTKRTILITGVICAVLLAGAVFVNAAPSNTRGRVAVDIGDFTYVSHSGGRSRGLSKEDNGYKLYYENHLFSNHDNDGVTYRSKKTYDMTDVNRLEFSAYANTKDSDKFMIYTTSSTDKTFHSKDRSDISNSMYDGQNPTVNGKVYSFSQFYTPSYSNSYYYTSFATDDTYDDRYVYIAMSKDIPWAKQGIMLQNNSYTQTADGTPKSGGISLMLKEHKVTLLAAEKPKCIDIYNNEETNGTAYADLEIALNDGRKYSINQTGSVYRDEEIVLTYRWGEGISGQVTGYNLYADKEKKTKIYHLQTNSSTIDFDADLIQDIEKTYGKALGDFYLEPVFKYDQATIEVSDTVAESDQIEIKKAAGSDNNYVLYDKAAGNTVVGTICLNNAKYVGDYLRIEYEKNDEYTGDYVVESFLLTFCDTRDQVDTATNTASFYVSDTNPDYNKPIETKYVRILPRTKLRAEVKLADKTAIFCNKTIEIDPATVNYTMEKEPPGIDKITYDYYTDEACTKELDGLPINAGVYYVIATMPGDTDYYAQTSSKPAKLTIEQAVPELKRVVANEPIIYGESLADTGGVNGDAIGVTGAVIAGTFRWEDDSQVLPAGYRMAKVVFQPADQFSNNYTTATGYGLVVVEADTVNVTVTDLECTYTGGTVPPNKVTAIGFNTVEPTGQEIQLDYYSDHQYQEWMENPPVYGGTYYVKATAKQSQNYNEGQGKGKVTVHKAPVTLLQIPVADLETGEKVYRVYMQGATVLPVGQIQLTIYADDQPYSRKPEAKPLQEKDGRFFAEFPIEGIQDIIQSDDNITIHAEYINDNTEKQDYENAVSIQELTDGTLGDTVVLESTYGDTDADGNPVSEVRSWNTDFFGDALEAGDAVTFKWIEADSSDVAEVSFDENSRNDYNGTVTVIPENAGRAYLLGYYKNENDPLSIQQGYCLYEIIVKKAKISVALENKTVTYTGDPVTVEPAVVNGPKLPENGSALPEMRISYSYYDADRTRKLSGPPTAVGTYYAVAETEETENYLAGRSEPVKIVIEPADAVISMKSKIVTYDGNAHTLDTVVEGSVYDADSQDMIPADGDLTYTYVNQKGEASAEAKDAGIYVVTASLTGDSIYKDTEGKGLLIIESEYAKLSVEDEEKVYDGEPADVKVTFQVNGESVDVPDEVYTEFVLQLLARGDTQQGTPENAGRYYIRASIDKGNYHSAYSNVGTVVIHRAEVEVTLPASYEEEYNGESVHMDSAVVTFDGKDVTEDFDITYEYYSDAEGQQEIEPPQYPGTYYVKAFAAGQRNFKADESEIETIVIKKRPVFLSDLKIHSPSKVTGTAVNKEGVPVAGQFYIADMEAFWQLPPGTHQVKVEFVPDTEAGKIYYGETGFATYTIESEEEPGSQDSDLSGDETDKDSGDPNSGIKEEEPEGGSGDEKNRDDIDEEHTGGPDTGDRAPIDAYLLLAAVAIGAAAAMIKKKSYDNRR